MLGAKSLSQLSIFSSSSYGGIQYSASAYADALDSVHILYVFLHNTTPHPVRADVTLTWRGESGAATPVKGTAIIPTLTLQLSRSQ